MVTRQKGTENRSAAPKDAGLEAARKLAKKHDDEPQHAEQVCETVLAFFDATKALHGAGDAERRLLNVAAILHDIGYSVDPDRHHKLSRDLIMESKLNGFSEEELRIVACIARYHRGGLPKKRHKVYADLNEMAQDTVCRLAALLRVADGLDRSHSRSTHRIRVEQGKQSVRVYVTQRRPSVIDIEGARRKRDLFECAFKLTLDVVPENT